MHFLTTFRVPKEVQMGVPGMVEMATLAEAENGEAHTLSPMTWVWASALQPHTHTLTVTCTCWYDEI